MKKHQAFSLVELSIVILVIGILIAGVIQGSNLVTKFRIKTAQTLTQSSPVASIKDLAFWVETTSEKSFSSEPDDGSLIGTWYDINPQSLQKNNAVMNTPLTKASYIQSGKNGIPILRFGNADSNPDYYNNLTLRLDSEISSFVVASTTVAAAATIRRIIALENNFIVGIGNSSKSEFSSYFGNGSSWNHNYSYGADATLNLNQYYILSSVLRGSSNKGYVNGVDVGNPTGSSSETKSVSTGYRIGSGGGQTWLGDIGEIIIFNRGLNDEERKAVEKYLSQKWGIAVSS